jgi:hypothetical protein
MKTEFETIVQRSSRVTLLPAPSLRVPVTARNRELLRRLRAAELSAWEAAGAGSGLSSEHIPARADADHIASLLNPHHQIL